MSSSLVLAAGHRAYPRLLLAMGLLAAGSLLTPGAPCWFFERVMFRRIPDRSDFTRLSADERGRYWRQVLAATRRMADEFHDLVSTGRWREVLRPLKFGKGGDIEH